jgi:hypothetical protein
LILLAKSETRPAECGNRFEIWSRKIVEALERAREVYEGLCASLLAEPKYGEKTDERVEHGRDNYHSKILARTSNFNWLSANR